MVFHWPNSWGMGLATALPPQSCTRRLRRVVADDASQWLTGTCHERELRPLKKECFLFVTLHAQSVENDSFEIDMLVFQAHCGHALFVAASCSVRFVKSEHHSHVWEARSSWWNLRKIHGCHLEQPWEFNQNLFKNNSSSWSRKVFWTVLRRDTFQSFQPLCSHQHPTPMTLRTSWWMWEIVPCLLGTWKMAHHTTKITWIKNNGKQCVKSSFGHMFHPSIWMDQNGQILVTSCDYDSNSQPTHLICFLLELPTSRRTCDKPPAMTSGGLSAEEAEALRQMQEEAAVETINDNMILQYIIQYIYIYNYIYNIVNRLQIIPIVYTYSRDNN